MSDIKIHTGINRCDEGCCLQLTISSSDHRFPPDQVLETLFHKLAEAAGAGKILAGILMAEDRDKRMNEPCLGGAH